MGAPCKGQPKRGAEPRSGVGPAHSTKEALEGNEGVEGRGRPGGNLPEKGGVRTQSRVALPLNLWRVYEAAKRNRQAQFTALMHHVDAAALERAFRRLKRKASAGVDGETVVTYEQDLESNLKDLCERVHTGRYRPLPVRRVYIPKADGGQRRLECGHAGRSSKDDPLGEFYQNLLSRAGSKHSPFFQIFNAMAAILRARVRRAIGGSIPRGVGILKKCSSPPGS